MKEKDKKKKKKQQHNDYSKNADAENRVKLRDIRRRFRVLDQID